MRTKTLKFRASFAEPGSFGLIKVKEVTFTLGMGPCGRFVTELDWRFDQHYLVIEQTSYPEAPKAASKEWFDWLKDPDVTNREIKTFVYKMSDVHGRITATE